MRFVSLLLFVSLVQSSLADCQPCSHGEMVCFDPLPPAYDPCPTYVLLEDPNIDLSRFACEKGADRVKFSTSPCEVVCSEGLECLVPIFSTTESWTDSPAGGTTSASTEVYVETNATTSGFIQPTHSGVVVASSGHYQLALALGITFALILIIATGGICGVKSIRVRVGQCCLRLRYRRVPIPLDFSGNESTSDPSGSGGGGRDNSALSVSNRSYTGPSVTSSSRSNRQSSHSNSRATGRSNPFKSGMAETKFEDVELASIPVGQDVLIQLGSPQRHSSLSSFTGAKFVQSACQTVSDDSWNEGIAAGRSGHVHSTPKAIGIGAKAVGHGGPLGSLITRLSEESAARGNGVGQTAAVERQVDKSSVQHQTDVKSTLDQSGKGQKDAGVHSRLNGTEGVKRNRLDISAPLELSQIAGVKVVVAEAEIHSNPVGVEAEETGVEETADRTVVAGEVSNSLDATGKESVSTGKSFEGGANGAIGSGVKPVGRVLPDWMTNGSVRMFPPTAEELNVAKSTLKPVSNRVDPVATRSVTKAVGKSG